MSLMSPPKQDKKTTKENLSQQKEIIEKSKFDLQRQFQDIPDSTSQAQFQTKELSFHRSAAL